MEELNIEEKTNNQGANSAGKLFAIEFNALKAKVNELVKQGNKTVYITEDEYTALSDAGELIDDVEYNIYDE